MVILLLTLNIFHIFFLVFQLLTLLKWLYIHIFAFYTECRILWIVFFLKMKYTKYTILKTSGKSVNLFKRSFQERSKNTFSFILSSFTISVIASIWIFFGSNTFLKRKLILKEFQEIFLISQQIFTRKCFTLIPLSINFFILYYLFQNNRLDMNECDASNAGCEHHCVNTNGSYVCYYNRGFNLYWNGKTCSDKFKVSKLA